MYVYCIIRVRVCKCINKSQEGEIRRERECKRVKGSIKIILLYYGAYNCYLIIGICRNFIFFAFILFYYIDCILFVFIFIAFFVCVFFCLYVFVIVSVVVKSYKDKQRK